MLDESQREGERDHARARAEQRVADQIEQRYTSKQMARAKEVLESSDRGE